jgi:ABC-type branched-subunit amino acid transport system substrate-binding protein
MKVLANAIELGGSAVPAKASANLRFMKDWASITGEYSFDLNGDVLGKKIFLQILSEGKLTIKSFNDE